LWRFGTLSTGLSFGFLAGSDSEEVGESEPKKLEIPTIRRIGDSRAELANTTLRSIRVKGKVNDQPVKWLVDTGATCTVVSDVLPIRADKIRKTLDGPRGAGGEALDCIGIATVKVTVGDMKEKEIDVYVIRGLPAIAILGTDSLQALSGESLTFDWRNKEMVLGEQRISMECRWRSERAERKLYVVEDVQLQAGKHSIIWAAADEIEDSLEKVVMLIEPYGDCRKNAGLIVAKSLVSTNLDNRVPVRVLCCGEDMLLKSGTPVGTLTDVKVRNRKPEDSGPRASNNNKGKRPRKLSDLLEEYSDVFSNSSKDLGRLPDKYQFRLETKSSTPVAMRARKVPHMIKEQIRNQVKDMQDDGICKTSNSSWASPVLLVKKANGEYRFACDYRELNKVTKTDMYPIGDLAAAQTTMAGAKLFSTLDLRAGYHQVPMSKEASEKSAFITQDGLFEWLRLPYGLRNAPGHFSRMMDKVLTGLTWELCLVYLDDVIVWGKDEQEHLNNLRKVFDRFREANVTLRPDKCTFMTTSVKYLGHVFQEGGYKPDPEKVKSLINLSSPEDVKGVKRILGMLSFYRRFIPNMAALANPMTELLKKDVPFCWTSTCEEGLRMMIELLKRETMLSYPDFDKSFTVTTDASQLGLGAVLSQQKEGRTVPIAFASRALRGAEGNWSARELETLGIVWAVEHFREFLYGKAFTLQSDHHSLQWLLKLKDPQGKMARWIERLAEYDFEIVYLPGAKNVVADVLSRHTPVEEETVEQCQTIDVADTMIEDDVWLEGQREDVEVREIKRWLRTGMEPKKGVLSEVIHNCLPCFSLNSQGLVVYKSPHKKNQAQRVFVPLDLVPAVMERIHENGGHFGYERTLEMLQRQCFFEKMTSVVKKWCKSCDVCARRKGTRVISAGCRERERVTGPWQIMDIDLMGPLKETQQGNKYVLGCIDRFTKYLFTIPLPNKKMLTVAKGIMRVNYLVGFVQQVHCDNGKEFINKLLEQALQICKIKSTSSLPYTPEQNGLIERTWRTFTDRVAMRVDTTNDEWDLEMDLATLQYNTSVNTSTKETPFLLNSGREAHFGTIFKTEEEERDVTKYCKEMEQLLPRKFKEVKKQEDKNIAERIARTGDRIKNSKKISYKEGDKVWFRRNVVKSKLDPKWEGPYIVKKVLSDITVRLRLENKNKRILSHVNKLKPYVDRTQDPEDPNHQKEKEDITEEEEEPLQELLPNNQWKAVWEESEPTTVRRRNLTARPMRVELTRSQMPEQRIREDNPTTEPVSEQERITIRLPRSLFNRSRLSPTENQEVIEERPTTHTESESENPTEYQSDTESTTTSDSDSAEEVVEPNQTITDSGRRTCKPAIFQAGQPTEDRKQARDKEKED